MQSIPDFPQVTDQEEEPPVSKPLWCKDRAGWHDPAWNKVPFLLPAKICQIQQFPKVSHFQNLKAIHQIFQWTLKYSPCVFVVPLSFLTEFLDKGVTSTRPKGKQCLREGGQKPGGNQGLTSFNDSKTGQMSGDCLEVETPKSKLLLSLSRAHALALEEVRGSSLCRICPCMSTNFYHCTMSHEIWGSNAHWQLGRGSRRDRGQEGWCWQPVCASNLFLPNSPFYHCNLKRSRL